MSCRSGTSGQLGEQRVQLGAGRRVAVDLLVGLLEGQRRPERDPPLAAVALAEIAAERQEALVVDVAAQLGLPLDAQQRAAPWAGGRGDPHRAAERVVPELEHGEPVDLTDALTVEVEQQRALARPSRAAAPRSGSSAGSCARSPAGRARRRRSSLPPPRPSGSPRRRGRRSRRSSSRATRGSRRGARHTRRPARRPPASKWRRPASRTCELSTPAYPGTLVRVPGHAPVELGLDAEQLADVLVERVGEFVERRRPDQHDLQVELDRLRVSVLVGISAYSSAGFSSRIRPVRRTSFSFSHTSGWDSTSAAGSIR